MIPFIIELLNAFTFTKGAIISVSILVIILLCNFSSPALNSEKKEQRREYQNSNGCRAHCSVCSEACSWG